jgi:ABC-2 type transport system permease protein
MTPRVAKYVAFGRVAATQALGNRAELGGRMVFVAIVLGVFSSLWRAVAEHGLPIAADRAALVWYLAATEWIVLTAPPAHEEIEREIRAGDVACHLTRPFSYPLALAAQGIGMILVRAPFIGVAAFVCGVVFTGTAPPAALLSRLVPFALAAMLLVYGLHVVIGLLAFWLTDVTPVFWIAQKLLFVLGGLMLPLTLYPEWMQRLAHLTPFPAMLGGPAGLLVPAAAPDVARLALDLAVWLAVVAIAARTLFQRAVRTLQVSGG